MHAAAFASLEWREAPMPGARPVRMALLPRLPDGGFRAFVRFPAAWSRPDPGHYAVPEEFLLLDGELRLDGRSLQAGGYAWIPARALRRELSSANGCLAFAWFASAPRWIPGASPEAPAAAEVCFGHWSEAPDGKLYRGPGHCSLVVQQHEVASLATECRTCETLDLHSFDWRLSAAAGRSAGRFLAVEAKRLDHRPVADREQDRVLGTGVFVRMLSPAR
jgi:hypothetical protein